MTLSMANRKMAAALMTQNKYVWGNFCVGDSIN